MMSLPSDVLTAYQGRTLATAESITGGGIGAALTAVPGSSAVYKGGVISYCDEVKASVLGVPEELLRSLGAVSAPVARAMAEGARRLLNTDAAVSVTGLAGPDGDGSSNPVGTVFIGFSDAAGSLSRECHFSGSRSDIREAALRAALELLLEKS